MGNSQIVTPEDVHNAVDIIAAGQGTKIEAGYLNAWADRATCVLVQRSDLLLLLDHPDEEWFRPPERQAVLGRVRGVLGE